MYVFYFPGERNRKLKCLLIPLMRVTPWNVYFFVVANQTLETIAVKVVEWIIVFKKYILLTLLRMLVSCRYFSFSLISSRTIWRHINTAWLPSKISKWLSTKSNFGFLWRRILFRIAGTLQVETSVSGKSEQVEAKNGKFFGVTFSFKK